LAVSYIVQKSHVSSKVKVKCQGHQGQKKRKTAESSPLIMHSRACAVDRPYAAKGRTQQQTIPLCNCPGVTGYAGGKISACCLAVKVKLRLKLQKWV